MSRLSATLTIAILSATLGCGATDPAVESFAIKVVSIQAPASVRSTDSISIHFSGGIGPDGCWDLAEVVRHRTTSALHIGFRGAHYLHTYCAHAPVGLDHTELVLPPVSGPFRIIVAQPDGSTLVDSVLVQ